MKKNRKYINKNGEFVRCPQCEGRGSHLKKTAVRKLHSNQIVYQMKSYCCEKCNGRGKINWVDRILGKKE